METVGLFVMLVGVAAFLSAWAHFAEQSRGLRVALYVVFGAASLLLLLAALGAGLTSGPEPIFWLLLALGLAIGLPLLPPFRRLLAYVMPLDPRSVPDMVGLSVLLAVCALIVGSSFAMPQQEVASVGTADLVLQAVAFILIAALGVGAFMTRDLRSTIDRLGLKVPSSRQVLAAVGLVLVAFVIFAAASLAMQALQPGLEREIEDRLSKMTRQVMSPPGALTLGVTAGVGEEILFRGAIQPRYGVVFTSIVFALLHVQYSLSLVVLGVFAVGLVLGYERQRMSTTAAIITHVVYDVLAVLLSAGF